MAGERTPSESGNPPVPNDDAISLREHMQRQIDVLRESAIQRTLIERELTQHQFNAAKEYVERIITDLALRQDERHEIAITESKDRFTERDKRYDQRFQGQEIAVQLALSRVDLEFHERLVSIREESKAALAAANQAILKSEVATEKRFEGVNEFRQQLADQAREFMPRKESDVRMEGLSEKIEKNGNQLIAMQLQVNSRLDLSQGSTTGGREAVQEKRANNSAVMAAVGFGISILLALITIVGVLLATKP